MAIIDPNSTIVAETFDSVEIEVPSEYMVAEILDGPISGGPSYYFNAYLAKLPGSMAVGAFAYDVNGAITQFAVSWPDGSTGQYDALVLSTAFPGQVDSYQVTYGSPVIKTYTQPTITRNIDGTIASKPAIVVS